MSDDLELFDYEIFNNHYMMISRDGCGYCDKALAMFNILGVPVTVKKMETDEDRQWFKNQGYSTYPRIFKNNVLIGGYDDFIAVLKDIVGNK